MLLTTFVGTLAVGAVAGWALEQQFGMQLVRWYRGQMMRIRVEQRRQGE
ncbi:MAG TPA: hypothetical protein VHN15_00580 [Thermoanaerobaculia bacterium]|nr:hypothetical protein [Thermoanaerobaculia bacterium]